MVDTFGPYELKWLIGRGGMGEVYNAYDSRHDRYVALKVLITHAGDDPEWTERFRRESHIVARMRHPHVIPVHSFGEYDGRLYLDMRLVEGTDLKDVIEHGSLSAERTVRIIEQVGGALDAAHAEGLVHRDVKPSNVLITQSAGAPDFAYLVDFGIARTLDGEDMTRTGDTIGTLSYMAPERFAGARPNPAIDIYALACVLFECLTGQKPFDGRGAPELMYAHMSRTPPEPSRYVPGLPSALDRVIAVGMAKDPAQRYRTAGELAVAARAALTARPHEHRPTQVTGPSYAALPMTPPTKGGGSSRRAGWLIGGAVAAAAAAAAVVLVVANSGDDNGTVGAGHTVSSPSAPSSAPSSGPESFPPSSPSSPSLSTSSSPSSGSTAGAAEFAKYAAYSHLVGTHEDDPSAYDDGKCSFSTDVTYDGEQDHVQCTVVGPGPSFSALYGYEVRRFDAGTSAQAYLDGLTKYEGFTAAPWKTGGATRGTVYTAAAKASPYSIITTTCADPAFVVEFFRFDAGLTSNKQLQDHWRKAPFPNATPAACG